MNYLDREESILITLQCIKPDMKISPMEVLKFYHVFQNCSNETYNYYPCDLKRPFILVRPQYVKQRNDLLEVFSGMIFNESFTIFCQVSDRFDQFNFSQVSYFSPRNGDESEYVRRVNLILPRGNKNIRESFSPSALNFYFYFSEYSFDKSLSIDLINSPLSLSNQSDKTNDHRSAKKQNSRVLLISNLGDFKKAKDLGRFFRCYQGLNKVLFMENSKKGLLEFDDPIAAKKCCEGVNRFEKNIKIRAGYSKKYEELQMNGDNLGENSRKYNKWYLLTFEKVRIFDETYVYGDISRYVQSFLIILPQCLPSENLFDGLIQLLMRIQKHIKKNPIRSHHFEIVNFRIIDIYKYSAIIKFTEYFDAVHFVSKFNLESPNGRKYVSRFI